MSPRGKEVGKVGMDKMGAYIERYIEWVRASGGGMGFEQRIRST